jgi:hypothetical protein
VKFISAVFSGGQVTFSGAMFVRGALAADVAASYGGSVSSGGVDFAGAKFSGATVDFSRANEWSVPPDGPWTHAPQPGVKLPTKEDPSRA